MVPRSGARPATWTYTYTDGWIYDGMARYQYVGDTVMTGSSAQIITRHSEGHFWPQDTVLVSDGEEFFTRVEGARVDLWNGAEFDTLYNFAAVPGDHWQLNTPAGIDPFLTITVQDTGHMTMDGLSLRYLVTTSSDTIIERLGSLPYHFVPWALSVLDAANGPLRCYSDADINYHRPWWPFGCTSIAEIPDTAEPVLTLVPNPGTDLCTVTMRPGAHVIRLCDATGRLLLRQHANGERATLNTHELPAGLYLVRVDDAVVPLRWIKL
ncbi:MAG: T9SS type A sorting domain-containing protein [Flavobacteriales bacterium]|nr:T9SS type A sorting domain-containing protein [Flavobacteriales bacterium]